MLQSRCLAYSFLVCIVSSVLYPGCKSKGPTLQLVNVKELDNYPSGSGLAFFNRKFYIIGDDAPHLLITTENFDVSDSVKLFETIDRRIPKETKPDLESIAMTKQGSETFLLLMGSGSLAPYRNVCRVVNPLTKEIKQYQLDTLCQRLRNQGITDLNIEGATATPFGMVLASRGNKSFRKNFLIICPYRFWEKQSAFDIKMIRAGASADTTVFYGVSGIDYSAKSDQLFLTVSSENTYNSYDDGSIGKSYLWVINDVSSKRKLTAINPDRVIDLEEIDSRFKGQKIESVCIAAEDKTQKQLVLAADDDKGHTVLFNMTWQ